MNHFYAQWRQWLVMRSMDQRALQVLSIYRWHCIKGLTKPYGHFTVLEV